MTNFLKNEVLSNELNKWKKINDDETIRQVMFPA